jgi:hypothetical protein
VDKCGTETCTAPGNVGGMNTCQVSCCTADNKCGQKNTAMQFMGTAYGTCRESAKEDKRCQKVLDSVDTGGLPITLTPCCTDTGLCGGSFNGTSCFDLAQGAMQFGGTAPSVKCVDAENWTPDSGTSGNDAGL